MDNQLIRNSIRTIPNFPKEGILFRDISTLFLDPVAWNKTIDELSLKLDDISYDKLIGVEARGFGIAGALGYKQKKGYAMARKAGKLPHDVVSTTYDLEYGSATLEIHRDALQPLERVVVIDDLLATGGTVQATCKLVESLGAQVVACLFIINLPDLKGAQLLQSYNPQWLVEFEGG